MSIHLLGRRSYSDSVPSLVRHGGRAGWIPVAAGYPPRHRAGQFVGDFDRLGNFVLYSVCSLSEMIPEDILIWFMMINDEIIF